MANSVSIRLKIDAAGADEVFQRVGRSGETTVEKIRVAFGRLGADSAQARVKIEAIDPTLQRLAGSLNVLRSRWDENYRAEQQMARAQDTLNRSVAAGLIPLAESERLLGRVRQGYSAINDNLRQHSAATATAAASAGQMRASLVNLGQQAQDVVVSLQAGQPAIQVLLQQGSQIATVFAATPGGVGGVLSAAGTAIRGIITPTTAAVSVVTALAVGFGFLLSRAMGAAEEVRKYNLIVAQTGRGSPLSAAQLQADNRYLQSLGVSSSIVQQQRLAVARDPRLTGSATQYSALGAGIGAFFGTGAEAGFEKLMSTIQAGSAGNDQPCPRDGRARRR